MNTITVHDLELPESFRQDFIEKIFKVIKAAESGIIIGPAGMGKTLALDVLEHHLKDFHLIRLDLNSPAFPSSSNVANKNIVIIGDNAENPSRETIQKLKSLREGNRPKTTILLAAEKNVLNHPALAESSSLRSIIMENVLYLPPLSDKDSEDFAKAIAKQSGIKLTPKQISEIVTQSGGAPRIIKRLVKLTVSGGDPKTDEKLMFDLRTLTSFCEQCPDYNFSSPLLSITAKQPGSKDKVGSLTFSETLTKQEAALAKALLDANGELVGREEMIKAIWPNNRYDTSEHALDQMIHRLKKKLETATPKCELITLRGRGAKLQL